MSTTATVQEAQHAEPVAPVAANSSWASTAGPIQTKRVNDAFAAIRWESNTYVELSGVIGGEERSTTFTQIFGGGRRDCGEALRRIGEKFCWSITRENYQQVIQECETELAVLKQNRPVKDTRESAEAVAKRQHEAKVAADYRAEIERKKTAVFVSLFAAGAESRQVPNERTVVLLKLCHDNSDIMTDYHDAHATLSPSLLLAEVPLQAETERLARIAVERYDFLKDVKFEWHTEKYAGGHGNYLSSSGHELPEQLKAWAIEHRRGAITHGHWEVQIKKTYRCEAYLLAKGLPARPERGTLELLKSEGWRWSRFSGCWYHRATEGSLYRAATTASLSPEEVSEIKKQMDGEAEAASVRGMDEACGIA